VICSRRGRAKLGVARGDYAIVDASEPMRDLLRVRTESGAIAEYAPERLRGVEVFREESDGDFRPRGLKLAKPKSEMASLYEVRIDPTVIIQRDRKPISLHPRGLRI
jgi:hypothetical protein